MTAGSRTAAGYPLPAWPGSGPVAASDAGPPHLVCGDFSVPAPRTAWGQAAGRAVNSVPQPVQ